MNLTVVSLPSSELKFNSGTTVYCSNKRFSLFMNTELKTDSCWVTICTYPFQLKAWKEGIKDNEIAMSGAQRSLILATLGDNVYVNSESIDHPNLASIDLGFRLHQIKTNASSSSHHHFCNPIVPSLLTQMFQQLYDGDLLSTSQSVYVCTEQVIVEMFIVSMTGRHNLDSNFEIQSSIKTGKLDSHTKVTPKYWYLDSLAAIKL
jgi:hypothetical protein